MRRCVGLLYAVAALVGCSSSEDADRRVDLTEAGISFALPGGSGRWLVADTDEMPENIMFVGVDTARRACLMFLQPAVSESYAGIGCLGDADLRDIVYRIAEQHDSAVTYDSVALERGGPAGRESVRFHTDVCVGAPADSFAVTFSGYLFDSAGPGLCGVVLTQPGCRPRTEADSLLGVVFESIAVTSE